MTSYILDDMAAREDSREKGLADYESLTPCGKCKQPGWRRTTDNRCLMCDPATLKRRAREVAELQKQQAKQARARARDSKQGSYWSSVPCVGCKEPSWRRTVGNTCLRCVPPERST